MISKSILKRFVGPIVSRTIRQLLTTKKYLVEMSSLWRDVLEISHHPEMWLNYNIQVDANTS